MAPRVGLTVLKGDATETEALAGAMKGADVVVSCIGNVDQQLVMERTANAVLSIARDQTTQPKCIFISSLGANGTSFIIKLVSILLGGRKTFADYDRADRLIDAENKVPYVLVRPTGYRDEPSTGTYKAFRKKITFGKLIARSDVAQFMFDATQSDQWNGPGGVQLVGQKE